MSVNSVTLVGNLGADPEKRQLETGVLTSFSLATSETYKDRDGEKHTNTEWHRCKAFGSIADVIAQFCRKGSQVYVEGKIKTSSYEKNGEKRYSTEIIVRNIQFLDKKPTEDESFPGNPNETWPQ